MHLLCQMHVVCRCNAAFMHNAKPFMSFIGVSVCMHLQTCFGLSVSHTQAEAVPACACPQHTQSDDVKCVYHRTQGLFLHVFGMCL